MLKLGQKGEYRVLVTEGNTALAMGSGDLPVFATPALAAAMEAACVQCVAGEVGPGNSTVGTALSLRHTSATPVGMQVQAVAELAEIDGRRLVFHVKAYDAAGVIGEATHERVLVERERFLKKAKEKGRTDAE